ncbi:Sel1 domain-containing protein [Reticulomyxa filosa]|uniref:Sel1 domain-containing protein n=1 Tax=Reticulomyxa filosa TaxID=46433 RepID=X6MQN6_RETFI|nr:Sel1 domain-containing protein [Reticulomyxa filosa]|eukprot:ETO15762.1 Sel1 domain-containing protein [Reticulomyxa filosa]
MCLHVYSKFTTEPLNTFVKVQRMKSTYPKKKKEYVQLFFLKKTKLREINKIIYWYYLGIMYEKGYHVPQNIAVALDYFKKAYEVCGHLQSLLKIGDSYFSGSGCVQDYKKAFDIYHILALNYSNKIACNNLGIMYEEGLGTDVNLAAAQNWYKVAADQVKYITFRKIKLKLYSSFLFFLQ